MKNETTRIDGELYLALETVADVYQVQVTWLERVYEFGLLGTGVQMEHSLGIAAVQLDRVATIVRLREVVGSDVESISLALPDE